MSHNIKGRILSSPVGDKHNKSVDDVVITTQREVLLTEIIGREGSKWYNNNTKILTINYAVGASEECRTELVRARSAVPKSSKIILKCPSKSQSKK